MDTIMQVVEQQVKENQEAKLNAFEDFKSKNYTYLDWEYKVCSENDDYHFEGFFRNNTKDFEGFCIVFKEYYSGIDLFLIHVLDSTDKVNLGFFEHEKAVQFIKLWMDSTEE